MKNIVKSVFKKSYLSEFSSAFPYLIWTILVVDLRCKSVFNRNYFVWLCSGIAIQRRFISSVPLLPKIVDAPIVWGRSWSTRWVNRSSWIVRCRINNSITVFVIESVSAVVAGLLLTGGGRGWYTNGDGRYEHDGCTALPSLPIRELPAEVT